MLERSAHQIVAIAVQPGATCTSTSGDHPMTFDARRLRTADLAAELAAVRPDVLLNVHSLYKVHPAVLDLAAVGAWNLHPGPLPEAAGINVPSWAIANRHQEHGVTVHEMTENYDEGAIAYEDRFPIAEGATGLTLSAECARRGLRLIKQLIDQLAEDPALVPRRRQALELREFYGTGQPNDGVVDWNLPALDIEAHVRAADFRPFESPWSMPRATVGDRELRLARVTIGEVLSPTDTPGDVQLDEAGEPLAVASANRWVRLDDWTEACS